MRNAALRIAAAFLTLGPAVAAVSAQEAGSLAEEDARFLAEAIRDGEAEVEMARMAEQKASAAEVKRFAERMVKDHGEMGRKLSTLAGERDIAAEGTYGPPQMQPDADADAAAAAAQRALEESSGRAFDQAYAAAAVEGHEKAVNVFEEAAEKAQDSEVRSLAAEGLPIIREHLEMARALAEQVGVTQ